MRVRSWYLPFAVLVMVLVALSAAAAGEEAEVAEATLEEGPAEAALFATPSGCETPGDGLELFVPEAQQQGTICGNCSQTICQGQPHDSICDYDPQIGKWMRCKAVNGNICPLEGNSLECFCTAGPIQ